MKEEELLEALEAQTSRVGVLPVLSLLLDRVTQGMYLEIFSDLCDLVTALTDGIPVIARNTMEQSVPFPAEYRSIPDVPRKVPAESVTIRTDVGGAAAHGGV
jgi:hypothetical protein